jgi:hypothetical protein
MKFDYDEIMTHGDYDYYSMVMVRRVIRTFVLSFCFKGWCWRPSSRRLRISIVLYDTLLYTYSISHLIN